MSEDEVARDRHAHRPTLGTALPPERSGWSCARYPCRLRRLSASRAAACAWDTTTLKVMAGFGLSRSGLLGKDARLDARFVNYIGEFVMRTLVIIPTYNERENILRLAHAILA